MRVIVTAGGTREPIDDVRVIANTSTGRLGVHLAGALASAGHEVILLHGAAAARPTARDGICCEVFGASSELAGLLERHVPRADVVIHAAAVADYVPVRAEGKLSSDAEELVLHLRRAPNLFQFLLVAGCVMLICLQAIINLGVVTGVFPTKGMSLPFISAGLSNLLLMSMLIGVIINTQRAWPRAGLSRKRRAMREVLA